MTNSSRKINRFYYPYWIYNFLLFCILYWGEEKALNPPIVYIPISIIPQIFMHAWIKQRRISNRMITRLWFKEKLTYFYYWIRSNQVFLSRFRCVFVISSGFEATKIWILDALHWKLLTGLTLTNIDLYFSIH